MSEWVGRWEDGDQMEGRMGVWVGGWIMDGYGEVGKWIVDVGVNGE